MNTQSSDIQQVVCYLRVSRQTSDTDRQESKLKAYANNNRYEIKDNAIFKETITGVSTAFEREKFKKMLQYIEDNQIKTILTTEISRIGRNKIDVTSVCEYFIKHKIQVIFTDNNELKLLNGKGDRDFISGIVIDVLNNFASMERETAIKRNFDGMRHSISIGGSGYGKVKPLGFKRIEVVEKGKKIKRLVVCEEEKAIIKEIFDLYLQGLGTTQIANHLNSKGIKTKFNRTYADDKIIINKSKIPKQAKDYKFVDGTIYTILKNKLYTGQRTLNEYELIDTDKKRTKANKRLVNSNVFDIEQIIDTDTFNRVQEMLKDKYNKKGNHTVYENILRHKLTCGVCGQNYFMHKRQNNNDNAYKCISVRYHNACGNYGINIDKMNNALFFLLRNYITFNNDDNKAHIEKINVTIQNLEITKNNTITKLELQNRQFENILTLNLGNANFQEAITKQTIILQENIDKLTAVLQNTNDEIQENLKLITDLENISYDDIVRDAQTFKKYVGNTIDKLTITKVQNNEDCYMSITEIKKVKGKNVVHLQPNFTVKGDKVVHCKLTTINQIERDFYLSQRSNKMLIPIAVRENDTNKPKEQQYIAFDIPLIVII